MREIENKNIKEKCYMEKLENGLQVIIIPKKEIQKKYIIWATKFGSIDNTFIDSTTGEKVVIPDGVAHFLEHKMFEQKKWSRQFICINGSWIRCKRIYNK